MAVDVDTSDTELKDDRLPDRCGGVDPADGEAPTAQVSVDRGDDPPEPAAKAATDTRGVRWALIVGSALLIAVAALAGWFGFRAYQSHQAQEQRNLFLEVGRQGALNLTTIDYADADADVKRILDSATGEFYDDFQQRSQPFVEVIRQAQAQTEGDVTEAGLESSDDDHAQVLVAVSVKTSHAGVPEESPRLWRMRVTVQKTDAGTKVSNVQFVP